MAVDICLATARSAGLPEEALLRHPEVVTMGPPRTAGPGVDALVLRAFGYLQQLPPPT